MFSGGHSAADGGFAAPSATKAMRVARPAPVLERMQFAGAADAATTRTFPSHAVDSSDVPIIAPTSIGTNPASASPRPAWLGRYQALLVTIDLVAGGLASLAAFLFRFGPHDGAEPALNLIFGLVLPMAWVAAIAANKAYERRFVGVGNAEFERVFRAFLHLIVVTVFIFYAADVRVARGYVFPALALALGLDLVGRYLARKWLHRMRRSGASMTSVIAIGGSASVAAFAALVRRDRHAGMHVVGACLPSSADESAPANAEFADIGVPVLGDVDSIADVVRDQGAHTVAVLSGEISAERLRWISWQLEGTSADLVVSPGLAEIGGRRLHIQPVAGLPLLHIEEPEFTGFRRLIKGAFDRIIAGVALLMLSPFLVLIGLAVRLTSSGPALFTQTRIGRYGREFRMVKFRSMCADAEDRRAELLTVNESEGVLFKIRQDPRVTAVGRVLRRFSLDELPQLLNVLRGSMSLVGPRPPLPDEVARYQDDVRRRLLVKPGLTGLWQISGRSDLSWEESVRLDLRYVEDWSLSLDLFVLWKTARAVVRATGAY
jgi:exopolysaccharide biosynthesis polyprenyl glycosylphosphotransferase